jgi:hypothetical protein
MPLGWSTKRMINQQSQEQIIINPIWQSTKRVTSYFLLQLQKSITCTQTLSQQHHNRLLRDKQGIQKFYFFFFTWRGQSIEKEEKNYGAMCTILGMQAPEMSSKRIFWNSLRGVFSIITSIKLWVNLLLANQSAFLFPFRRVCLN